MPGNTERFTGRAEAYERFRNRFPDSLLARIQQVCAFTPASVVADIGAGTGMLAELFLRNGNPVIAVEPNDDMRAACDRLALLFPALTVIGASAEQTSLPDACCDLIVVGRAFHWFDRERAMDEFRRILRPAGSVVLVTTRWSGDGSPEAEEFQNILHTRGVDFYKYVEGQLSPEEMAILFDPASLAVETVHGRQELTLAELKGRVASLSVSPREDDPRFHAMQHSLETYFERFRNVDSMQFPVGFNLVCGKPARR